MPGADRGVQAVMWLFKSSCGGRLPLLSAMPAVTFPAEERHRPLTGTNYTAWWQMHIGVNNLPKVAMQLCPGENRTHELMIADSTLYRYATAPPCVNVGGHFEAKYVRWRVTVIANIYKPLDCEMDTLYNLAAIRFDTMKLYGRLYSIEIEFYSQKRQIRFMSHSWGT